MNKLIDYYEKNDKNISIKLKNWRSSQITEYKNISGGMKNEERRIKWKNFVQKYKDKIFIWDYLWKSNLLKCDEFIIINNKRPSQTSKNIEEQQLGNFITTQHKIFKLPSSKNDRETKKERRKQWNIFIEKHNNFFVNDLTKHMEDEFNNMLSLYVNFINNKNIKPREKSFDKNENKLGKWYSHQKQNYKNIKHNMKNQTIRKLWENFINDPKYKKYF